MDSTIIGYLSEWLGAIAVTLFARLSPRCKFRPVGFQYPKRELWVTNTLYFVAICGALWFYQPGRGLPAADPLGAEFLPSRMILGIGITILAAVTLLLRRQPLKSAGWSKETFMPALQLGLAIGFAAIFLSGKMMRVISGTTSTNIALLGMAIVLCAAEETVFRGFIQLRLNSLIGTKFGWIITAVAHILWQLPMIFLYPGSFPVNLLIIAASSFVSGYMMLRCGNVFASTIYRSISVWIHLL